MKKHAVGGCWMYDFERFLKWLHGNNVSCILGWFNWGKKVVSHFFPSSKLPIYFICMTRGQKMCLSVTAEKFWLLMKKFMPDIQEVAFGVITVSLSTGHNICGAVFRTDAFMWLMCCCLSN